jgi:hypothetical protein
MLERPVSGAALKTAFHPLETFEESALGFTGQRQLPGGAPTGGIDPKRTLVSPRPGI